MQQSVADHPRCFRSRAEIARLKKRERALERANLPTELSRGAGADSDSDGSSASTDLQSLSDELGSANEVGSNETVGNSDSELSSSDIDVETEHAARVAETQKRIQRAQARQNAAAAERKLPVRSCGGWASASNSDSAAEDAEGGDGSAGKVHSDQRRAEGSRAIHDQASDVEEDGDVDDVTKQRELQRSANQAAARISTITSSARFGMLAPYDIMGIEKRGDRIQAAREQIARLATDVVADPEMSLGLLRRLAVFANRNIPPPPDSDQADANGKRIVDDAIRGAAIMSMCAVFTDILPGYRIRPLSEAEQKEKTNQETARRREFEQGLVDVYRQYLDTCDKVINGETLRAARCLARRDSYIASCSSCQSFRVGFASHVRPAHTSTALQLSDKPRSGSRISAISPWMEQVERN